MTSYFAPETLSTRSITDEQNQPSAPEYYRPASPTSEDNVHFPEPGEVEQVFLIPTRSDECPKPMQSSELKNVFNPFEIPLRGSRSSRILSLESELHSSSAVEISVECQDIPRVDLFNQNEVFGVVLSPGMTPGEWDELDRTEIISCVKCPQFVHRIRLPASSPSDRQTLYKIRVFNRPHGRESLEEMDLIAESDFSIQEIISEKKLSVQKALVSDVGRRLRGRVSLTLHTIAHERVSERYKFDFGFAPDAPRRNRVMFVIARGQRAKGSFSPVYRSEVRLRNDLEKFNPACLTSQELHGGDQSRLVRLEVYRYYKSGDTALLGFIQTSVDKLKGCRVGSALYWWPGSRGLTKVRVKIVDARSSENGREHWFSMCLSCYT